MTEEPSGLQQSGGSGPTSTRTLLDRFRRGRASAAELLFSREIPGLQKWARGRLPAWARSVVDTADLVQDALTHTFQQLRRFEPERDKALRAYLRTAVDNRIRDELRRSAREPLRTSLSADTGREPLPVPAHETSPLDAVIEAEDEALLARALRGLSSTDRMAVVARLRLGYSYEQIALLLNKRSANTARMTVTRAIERLAEGMRSDVEHTTQPSSEPVSGRG
jgi:RNA polymerase sigma-70 factor (ECF subfamily)